MATLRDDIRRGGKYLHKTLWAVAPDTEPLAVRGTSLRTGNPITFVIDGKSIDVLQLPRASANWSYAATTTALPGAGCYAFHVIGKGVNDQIVFKATLR